MQPVQTDHAPAAIGPYSQAVMKNGLLFISGQLGLDPAAGTLAAGIEAQTRRALQNLVAILKAAGLGPQNVLKATVYVASMDDFALVNKLYAEVFTPPFPARDARQGQVPPRRPPRFPYPVKLA